MRWFLIRQHYLRCYYPSRIYGGIAYLRYCETQIRLSEYIYACREDGNSASCHRISTKGKEHSLLMTDSIRYGLAAIKSLGKQRH
ncbi:MAG: hypothetical protein ACLTS6_05080 [Anaerobutyricum sp.]